MLVNFGFKFVIFRYKFNLTASNFEVNNFLLNFDDVWDHTLFFLCKLKIVWHILIQNGVFIGFYGILKLKLHYLVQKCLRVKFLICSHRLVLKFISWNSVFFEFFTGKFQILNYSYILH
jgi:hypothetical protein